MKTELSTLSECAVRIPCDEGELTGDLVVPAGGGGLVIFAHGSGSSRMSPRSRMVARVMNHHHQATLLLDLLTPREGQAEERGAQLRFNIPLLISRLAAAILWARENSLVNKLGLGLFGASTGAAAALGAAARMPEIQAVVSRGGRTDMAGADVENVLAPTLLIVGEYDRMVMDWNARTLERLPGIKHLVCIPGATHLFEEPGALEEVAACAAGWFEHYLTPTS